MIESVRLRNFQKHQNLIVEFSKHVTSIIGDTDAGKSSILRAIRWVATDRPPRGTYLCFDAGPEGCVRVHVVADGSSIVRIRGPKRNLFKFDGKPYLVAKRDGYPEDISRVLNLSEDNFAMQLDGPLWFVLSAPQVSRELNAIVNLSQIDKILSLASAQVRDAKTEVRISRDRLKTAKEEVASLAWIKEAQKEYAGIDKKASFLSNLSEKHSVLSEICVRGSKLVKTVQRALDAHSSLTKALSLARKGMELEQKFSSLLILRNRLVQTRIAIDYAIPASIVNSITSIANRYRTISNKLSSLQNILSQIQTCQEKSQKSNQLKLDAQKKLDAILTTQCPMCGKTTKTTSKS